MSVNWSTKLASIVIVIAQEKGHQQLRNGIEQFDTAKMKKVETLEKNPLPTQEGNRHSLHSVNT